MSAIGEPAPAIDADPRRALTIPDGRYMFVSLRALEEMRQHRFWRGFAIGFGIAIAATASFIWFAVHSVG